MAIEERVLIAGAGPVGLTAAANLVRGGVPVTVFEAGGDLSEESRASTFHPPTLDMLDRLGAAKPLIAQGLTAPAVPVSDQAARRAGAVRFRRHRRRHRPPLSGAGRAIQADPHPVRAAARRTDVRACSSTARSGSVAQHASGVEIAIERDGRTETRSGRWLIGADGARSDVRRSLGIEFRRLHLAGALPGREHAVRLSAPSFRTWWR